MKSEVTFDSPITILDSGSLIQYSQNDPVTIGIVESDGTPINARIETKLSERTEGNGVSVSMYDKSTFLILLTSAPPILNMGFLEPMVIGSFNGRTLLFNLRVTANNIGDPATIYYTWFLGADYHEGN